MTALVQTTFVHGWMIGVPLLVLAVLWLWAALAEEPDDAEANRPLWDDLWDGNVVEADNQKEVGP